MDCRVAEYMFIKAIKLYSISKIQNNASRFYIGRLHKHYNIEIHVNRPFHYINEVRGAPIYYTPLFLENNYL